MCSLRGGVLVLTLVLAVSGWSQQPSVVPSPAPQDPQAVSVLNQALAAAGGATAIGAIADYTAIGTVTYHWNPEEQGPLTIQALGLDQIRLDANPQSGKHSEVVNADGLFGAKGPNGRVTWFPFAPTAPGESPKRIPTSDTFPYLSPKFAGALVIPSAQLLSVLGDSTMTISYVGTTEIFGRRAANIQVGKLISSAVNSMAQYNRSNYFIDSATYELLAVQDVIPKNNVHQISYADYKQVGGVAVPFSITEEIGGQIIREIELNEINFNLGLQDSAFAL